MVFDQGQLNSKITFVSNIVTECGESIRKLSELNRKMIKIQSVETLERNEDNSIKVDQYGSPIVHQIFPTDELTGELLSEETLTKIQANLFGQITEILNDLKQKLNVVQS